MSGLLHPDVEDLDNRSEVAILFKGLKLALPELEALLEKCSNWAYEDYVYRFYHQSFKVYQFVDCGQTSFAFT